VLVLLGLGTGLACRPRASVSPEPVGPLGCYAVVYRDTAGERRDSTLRALGLEAGSLRATAGMPRQFRLTLGPPVGGFGPGPKQPVVVLDSAQGIRAGAYAWHLRGDTVVVEHGHFFLYTILRLQALPGDSLVGSLEQRTDVEPDSAAPLVVSGRRGHCA
jgi:hypothetical protein